MRKNVVIVKDTKGNTCYVAFPKMLEEHEINKAVNECLKYEEKKERKYVNMVNDIAKLESNIEKLEKEIKILKGEE